MASTINASSTANGIVSTADASGILKVQSNGVTVSALAWVNFQGGQGNTAGTVNASYNVSSVSVNGTGDYTINFTNALANTYYAAGMGASDASNFSICSPYGIAYTLTTSLRVACRNTSNSQQNAGQFMVSIFGN